MSNDKAQAAQAVRAGIEAALAAGFLAENYRFRLSFGQTGFTHALASFRNQLEGEWVALLPASNDSHMRFLANIRALLDDHDAKLRAANERIAALRTALESLVGFDSYQTEYDGRMYDICPSCGDQDGTHKHGCAFTAARAVLATNQDKPA